MTLRPLICGLLALLALTGTALADGDTLSVEGRHLYTPCGERVVLMGPSRMVYWLDRTGLSSFTEIARTGANTVRIVWTPEGKAGELDTVLNNARRLKLIPIVELQDTEGGDTLPIEYWLRPEIAAVIDRHRRYTILNIGNRLGENVALEDYRDAYTRAIRRLREAGHHLPLMLDAPGWGRDIDLLQAAGPALIESDPRSNILLSVHMWWPQMWGYSEARIAREMAESVRAGLPLVIGEFGDRWDDSEGGAIAYRTIIQSALEHDIGFLPWSWGPGNKPQKHLDMTDDGTLEGLTGWGREIMIDEPYAIANNAIKPNWECLVNGER